MNRTRPHALVIFVIALLLGVLAVPSARAQMGMGGGMNGSDFQVPISRRGVDSYSKILGLDEDQKAAVLALHEGYRAGHKATRDEIKKAMEEVQAKFRDTMDMSVFKDMNAQMKPLTEKLEGLEKQFFADLRSLLNEEQGERFPKVERFRRRETGMMFAVVGGARVDLLDVLEKVGVSASADPSLSETVTSYELDLDRLLAARETGMKAFEEDSEKITEEAMQMNFSRLEKLFKSWMDLERPMRELNKNYARRITPMLPAEKQPLFETAFRQRAFPAVYKTPHTMKEIEAALKLEDLDAGKRAQIESMKAAYERDLEPANAKWAAAIEEKDDKGLIPFMAMRGGSKDNPTAGPKSERRELDKSVRERLHALLSDEQKEKLPKEPKRDQAAEAMEMMGMDIDPELMNQMEEWGEEE